MTIFVNFLQFPNFKFSFFPNRFDCDLCGKMGSKLNVHRLTIDYLKKTAYK